MMRRWVHIAAMVALAAAVVAAVRPAWLVRTDGSVAARRGAEARFETADVYIESGALPLGAWQVEIAASVAGGSVQLAGVAGGDGAFAQPPNYDPDALQHDRIVLAAFSLAKSLPSGRVRVAQLQLQVEGSDRPVEFVAGLRVAVDGGAGEIIGARVVVVGGDAHP